MIHAHLAKACSGRFHYAWVTLGVVFCAILAGVGVRAAPGVMIVPLQQAFGAGAVRSFSGSYLMAFIASGVACLMASMLVLRVTPRAALVAAE